jgi:hypothetical protein
MSDTEPGDEQGEGAAQGDEQGEDGSGAGADGDEAPEGSSEPEGSDKGNGSTDIDGNDRGEQPADVKADDDGSEAEAVKQGAHQGEPASGASTGSAEEQPFDPDENDSDALNDPCTVAASKDERDDSRFQKLADKVNKGKREGMRRRSYRHSPASVYQTRVVVSVPRKGKRWVYDF